MKDANHALASNWLEFLRASILSSAAGTRQQKHTLYSRNFQFGKRPASTMALVIHNGRLELHEGRDLQPVAIAIGS
jgi:hypothetical protein